MKPLKIPNLTDFEHEAISKVRDQLSVSSVLFVRTVVMMAIDELAIKTAKQYADSIFSERLDELRFDDYGK